MMKATTFTTYAERSFSFLEKKHGFDLVEKLGTRLIYEKAKVHIGISWEPRSGELNLYFWRSDKKTSEPRERVSLIDLLKIKGVDRQEAHGPFQVKEEDLEFFIKILADDLILYGQDVLDGNPMFFRRVLVSRDGDAKKVTNEYKLRGIRSKVDDAWQRKDFGKIVELLSLVEKDLTEVEKSKLEYARKNINRDK